jgi:hypothetical protein
MPRRRLAAAGAVAAATAVITSATLGAPASAAVPAQQPPLAAAARGAMAAPQATAGQPAVALQVAGALAGVQPGGPITLARGQGAGPRFVAATQNVRSTNWGGYVALRRGTRFRYVRATFFVPYLHCAQTPGGYSGHWVGLDGLKNATVEQDGILAACQGSTPAYAAWWEMFPNPPVYPNIAVRPGNSILASVFYSARTHRFTLALTDTTNGHHFAVMKSCPASCQRTTAEVISEAPSSGAGILPLADFRAEGYSSIRVTSQHGRRGGLRARWWNTLSVTTVNGHGAVLDQPTSIFRGTAFGMYWMRMS